MRDFFMEIEVEEQDERIVALDTDNMDINIYQKINGKRVRIFEIICFKGASGVMTIAEFVGKKNCKDIDVEISPDKVMSIHS